MTDEELAVFRDLFRQMTATGAISVGAGESARAFFSALHDDMPCPQIGPDGEGDVMVVWGSTLLVTIEADRLHMVTRPTTPEARYFDDMLFDGTALPAEVAAAIAEAGTAAPHTG